mgnify:CR=1 FL=1
MKYVSRALKKINWFMVLCLAVILFYSVIFIMSAAFNIHKGDFSLYIYKQCIWIFAGLIVFLVTIQINYRLFHRYAYVLYAAGIIGMLIPFFFRPVKGTHSWMSFGLFSFQPSEMMKVFYVIAMARFLENWQNRDTFTDLINPFIITGIPFSIIILQPDLGTASVFLPVMFIMIFMAGVRLRYLAAAALMFILICPLGLLASNLSEKWFGKGLISPYQKERVTAFLDPEKERLGVSYQSYQSLAAIGSGKVLGRGLGNGQKTQFDQLPAKHTDFIISVIAEEGGFLAVVILLAAFYGFLLSAFLTAHNAPDVFGRLVAVGIIGIISSQIIINVGVAVSLLPITGITLPFVSYGGSSLLSSFFAIGVVMSVGKEKKPYFS